MIRLTFGVAIFDLHTRLAHLEADASLLATLSAAGVDLVHPGHHQYSCQVRSVEQPSCGGRFLYPNYYINENSEEERAVLIHEKTKGPQGRFGPDTNDIRARRIDEDVKKAKFHYEAAAMAGDEEARYMLGGLEAKSGKIDLAIKHWTIAASAGDYIAMHHLRICFEKGHTSRESINSTLAAYNTSCSEMRSEARDDVSVTSLQNVDKAIKS
jgi:TPR repeat protein